MTAPYQFNRIGQSRHGTIIYNINDPIVGRSVEMYGEYSEQAAAVFDQILQPNALVLDIGANIGVHTLFLAHKVAPAGRVLAFEPQRLLFQTLCGNMAINSVDNAFCWNMAVGASNGETTVPGLDLKHPEAIAGVALGTRDEGESVPIITIDSLNLPQCDLIKIGCEGMEDDIISGAAETIVRHKPIIYIECNRSEAQPELIRQIDSVGYSMFWHETVLFNPNNFKGNPENVFGEACTKNILCLDKAAERQLTGFSEVEVPRAA